MNSEEVQAEFEFDDGESNSESNPVKPPSPFVRRGNFPRDISSKKLPMNLRQGCGYGSFEDIETPCALLLGHLNSVATSGAITRKTERTAFYRQFSTTSTLYGVTRATISIL